MKLSRLKQIIKESIKEIQNKQLLNEEWVYWPNVQSYCEKCAQRGKCCESSGHGLTGAELACTKCKPDEGVGFTIPGSNTTIQLGKGVDKSKFTSDYKKGKGETRPPISPIDPTDRESGLNLQERFQELSGITPLYTNQILLEKKFGWKDIKKAKQYCDDCYDANKCCQFGGGGADYVKINCVTCGKKGRGDDKAPDVKKLSSSEISSKLNSLKDKKDK